SRVPEVAHHIVALRAMHAQLDQRFTDLVREREETATLIETMADGVVAADARGTIVTLNSAGRRLLGYGPDDPFPALAELFHEKPARDLVATVLAGLEAEPHELERGGRTLLVTGRALPNGGGLLVIRDVTELRRLEAVRRDFVANVSHVLQSPRPPPALGFPRGTCPASSDAATAPIPAARAKRAAPDSASPS